MSTTLLKIGIGAGIVLAAFILHQVDRRAAIAEGVRDERLVWQERQARADAKAEADRRAAQAKIGAIESEYWQRAATDAARLAELEEELAREKDDPAAAAGCAPLVGKRVRDRLDAIGRD